MNIPKKAYLIIALLITSNIVLGQEDMNSNFEGVTTEIVLSEYVKESYKLSIGLPFGYDQNKEYQVLYVLDANVTFGMVNDITKLLAFEAKHPSVIVVGVAYKSTNDWMRNRGRDLMPNYSGISGDKSVSKFHQFISLELIPHINKKFKTKQTENILYGHSSGAVYGLYSLFKDPNLFKSYILTSPSVDEDSGFIVDLENKYYSKFKELNANLYTSIGSEEKESFNKIYSQFIESLKKREYINFRLNSDAVLGTHMSSMAQAFINGFHFINGNKF
jgi:hypothetical protein